MVRIVEYESLWDNLGMSDIIRIVEYESLWDNLGMSDIINTIQYSHFVFLHIHTDIRVYTWHIYVLYVNVTRFVTFIYFLSFLPLSFLIAMYSLFICLTQDGWVVVLEQMRVRTKLQRQFHNHIDTGGGARVFGL